jgi:hypothetical protein
LVDVVGDDLVDGEIVGSGFARSHAVTLDANTDLVSFSVLCNNADQFCIRSLPC